MNNTRVFKIDAPLNLQENQVNLYGNYQVNSRPETQYCFPLANHGDFQILTKQRIPKIV